MHMLTLIHLITTYRRRVCLLAAFLCHLLSPSNVALARHPISITEASMFVSRAKALVRIQMFAEDLVLFQGIEPNDQDRLLPDDLKDALEKHKAFLLEKFTLRNADGERFRGQVTGLQPFEIPADGIASSEMMQHTATYELEFSFESPPEFITIQQDITDENFIVPSEMSLNVHQAGTGLNFSERLMPGGSTSIRFDWTQTLSENATDDEWDSWFEKQREATLGITSYSSVYSFIYIEPAEVRHEILIPLATLKTIVPVKHKDPAFVEIDEQDAVRSLIREWLGKDNSVQINGTPVEPEFSRIDLYSLNLSDFAAQAAAQRVSLASGRVGIIMRYRTPDDVVRDVKLSWNKFYSTMNKIPAVVIAYPDRMDRFEFSRFNKAEDNQLSWTCRPEDVPTPVESIAAEIPSKPQMRIPVGTLVALVAAFGCLFFRNPRTRFTGIAVGLFLAVVCWPVGAVVIAHPWLPPAEIPSTEAQQVFTELHQGMYRSMDSGSEERIYDVLAKTVDGSLLEETYLKLRQSLELREQGGAIARIRNIQYDDTQLMPRQESVIPWPAFQVRSTWTVAGTVEHWGHVHERQNQFEAIFTVEPREGTWKLTRMDIEGQSQKSARTTLRKF
jgi:hypothetical protein